MTVISFSTIGEGCKRQMEPVVHEILNNMILPRLIAAEHPRVRYAACNAIGQMCTDFAPTMVFYTYLISLFICCSYFSKNAAMRESYLLFWPLLMILTAHELQHMPEQLSLISVKNAPRI